MGLEQAADAAPAFRAFISYSHTDSRFAEWLHRRLERTRVSRGERLAPIFIDRAELAAGPDLTLQVRDALAGSAALIVIASPAARASRWVAQEIELFRQIHPDRPVLAALVAADPAEAFPDALLSRQGRAVEPLAADFRDGQDGRRLGLLKIVAGLTGQRLDRLVQRDSQARQRRVMAVTASAVLLSLVLAAALVSTIRSRAEAERQRNEAEGLVEFMLTDLRDKLKGVGRLDIMDTVNQRVLQRYADEPAPDRLPGDALLRRAHLLQAMAEDDLAASGQFDRGLKEAEAAARLTRGLLQRSPDDSQAILAHAKSEFWLGQARFLDKRIPAEQRAAKAYPHWQEYRRLTGALAGRANPQSEWLVEASYAEGNLCALALARPARPREALPHCRAATDRLEAASRLGPADVDVALNLASAYAWQADALAKSGDARGALALRSRQDSLVEQLEAKFPDDQRIGEARLLADFGMARLLLSTGNKAQAAPVLSRAGAKARELESHDPQNGDWSSWRTQISALQAEAR